MWYVQMQWNFMVDYVSNIWAIVMFTEFIEYQKYMLLLHA